MTEIGRNYVREKEELLELVSKVLETKDMIECDITIHAEIGQPTMVDYECKVIIR